MLPQVPFRLTRMMIKAMEVSGLEGNFRTMAEAVMRVLRTNKESVTAMLEAFVYDPLINWRLLHTPEVAQTAEAALAREHGEAGGCGWQDLIFPSRLCLQMKDNLVGTAHTAGGRAGHGC